MFTFVIIALIVFIYFALDTLFVDYIKHRKTQQMVLKDIDGFLKKELHFLKQFMEQHQNKFKCDQCQNIKNTSNVIALRGLDLGNRTLSKPHKFLMTSCQSCAYTEMYNLNVKFKNDHYDIIKPQSLSERNYIDKAHTMQCNKCHDKSISAKRIILDRPRFKSLFTPSYLTAICYSCRHCGYSIFLRESSI